MCVEPGNRTRAGRGGDFSRLPKGRGARVGELEGDGERREMEDSLSRNLIIPPWFKETILVISKKG
jgi:hypothetical protein